MSLGTVITAVVPKGGTGKTTVTMASAVRSAEVLSKLGKRVCLVEANVQQANISRYMGAEGKVQTLSLISTEQSLDMGVIRRVITRDSTFNLDILFGASRPEDANPELLTPRFYRQVVQQLIREYDYVWIDAQSAEPYDPMFTDFILRMTDRLMVVLDHNQIAIEQTIDYLQSIVSPRHNGVGHNVARNSVGIVLNQYREQSRLSISEIRAQLNAWTWWGSIPFMQEWKDYNSEHKILMNKEVCKALDPILYLVLGGEPAFAQANPTSGRTKKSGGGLLRKMLK